MTAPVLAQGVGESRSVTPTKLVCWLIVGAACAAAAASVELAVASDRLAERELQAALLNWVTLPYIVAGVIAWSRRPESAFGPLMITVGVVMFISTLQWANATAPYTVGLAYDLLPAALFLHLFLAFPSGRLGRMPREQWLLQRTSWRSACSWPRCSSTMCRRGMRSLLSPSPVRRASSRTFS